MIFFYWFFSFIFFLFFPILCAFWLSFLTIWRCVKQNTNFCWFVSNRNRKSVHHEKKTIFVVDSQIITNKKKNENSYEFCFRYGKLFLSNCIFHHFKSNLNVWHELTCFELKKKKQIETKQHKIFNTNSHKWWAHSRSRNSYES